MNKVYKLPVSKIHVSFVDHKFIDQNLYKDFRLILIRY